MMRRAAFAIVPVALAISFSGTPVSAATFDLIYADRLEVTTYPSNVGFTLSGTDAALVVNTGPTNTGAAEFFGTTYTVLSSNPAVQAIPFINNPGPPITPILPNEALGSVSGFNGVLTTRLNPWETLRNTHPLQVISLQVNYPSGFSGSVAFDITMTMGTDVARYTLVTDFTLGQSFNIAFPSAARTSSIPVATPAHATTWGALKRLYR